ncbi:hypothetical protein L1987_20949 [Smallanthus sonchifolius]|uniref:Uncharacterized protein n=1 Tax=Smallanthus sonchifolius TaxID=185202 RepID=A0ACB9IT98_9ASTR|nr:hypothetical protein L1987_20949 [Smallanthus sonchifolius]
MQIVSDISDAQLRQETRLLTLIEGVLAANIFDWGSRACVDLYHKGTIIEIYRMNRKKMQRMGFGDKKPCFCHKRALLFVDNSGPDVVLGMFCLARGLLSRGKEATLNDVTTMELPKIVAEAAKHCDILRGAAEASGLLMDAMIITQDNPREKLSTPLMVVENGCGSPCIDLRKVSSELAPVAKDADLGKNCGVLTTLFANMVLAYERHIMIQGGSEIE